MQARSACADASRGLRWRDPRRRMDALGHEDIANPQRRVERSAESDTDNRVHFFLLASAPPPPAPPWAVPAPFATSDYFTAVQHAPHRAQRTGQSSLPTFRHSNPIKLTPIRAATSSQVLTITVRPKPFHRAPQRLHPPVLARISQLARGLVVRHPHFLARHAHARRAAPAALSRSTRAQPVDATPAAYATA